MMREWPYTASNRDELGCTSPLTSRFPLALEKSLGPLSSVRIQCFRIEGLLVFFFINHGFLGEFLYPQNML